MKNCPKSQLSGFPPTKTTVQTWMEKLKANGITDGCLCRLVHGRDEDKIVKFENYHVNDLGVCIDGGYFLFQDGDTLKVAEPLFVPLLELTEDVRFVGQIEAYERFAYFHNSHTDTYATISEKAENVGVITLQHLRDKVEFDFAEEFIQFRTAQDLFAWMALND